MYKKIASLIQRIYWAVKLPRSFRKGSPIQTMWVDDEPEEMEPHKLYVVGQRESPIKVMMKCPIQKCSDVVNIPVHKKFRPSWTMIINDDGALTLYPSVQSKKKCNCHFWIINGNLQWYGINVKHQGQKNDQ